MNIELLKNTLETENNELSSILELLKEIGKKKELINNYVNNVEPEPEPVPVVPETEPIDTKHGGNRKRICIVINDLDNINVKKCDSINDALNFLNCSSTKLYRHINEELIFDDKYKIEYAK